MGDSPEHSNNRISVVLAEDHHVIRRALVAFLRRRPELNVVAEAEDGPSLKEAVAKHRPDILLMDLKMPDHQPVEAVRDIRRRYPETKVIVLSAHVAPQYVVGMFEAGVQGYVVKDDAADAVSHAIAAVMQGDQWVSPQAAHALVDFVRRRDRRNPEELTDREQEVLTLTARGMRNEDIADKLSISKHTVRNHLASIYKKLDVDSRLEAAVLGLTLGIIPADEVRAAYTERA